jgi:hypothetical protein
MQKLSGDDCILELSDKETNMPYLNEGKKGNWSRVSDGVRPNSGEAVKMPAPVKVPPPTNTKAK